MGRRLMNTIRKYIKWAAIAFLVWYVINKPDAAGIVVQNSLKGLGHAATSLSTFVTVSTS
jgi:hypothetical protein